MDILIWIGAAISLIGVAGLVACIVIAAKARTAGLSDEALRNRLKGLVALNMGALMVSAIGLMCVVIGIMLG
ncbi:MAG: hypothetical protein KDA73_17015 [Rhodobacteraceae bacterium]|nr:hypothetical protein [Paracoccaceae bacterium]